MTSLIYTTIFSQNHSVADRYFKQYSYVKSAKIYSEIIKKGDSSELVLKRLADSYYNISDIKSAKKWYTILFKKHSNLNSEYYYKYAKILEANGDIEKSKSMFDNYIKKASTDVRAKNILSGLSLDKKNNRVFENVTNLDTNTKYSDFNGIAYNNSLYFFSTKPLKSKGSKIYKWNQQPYLNIYKGTINNESKITNERPLEGEINTKFHEATLTITKDGRTMYFTRDNSKGNVLKKDKKKVTNLKIYKAELVNDLWGNIKELPFNNDSYSTGHPTLNHNDTELYFVSNMPGSFGGSDIYKVDILGNDTYSTPKNLGSSINTEGMEMFPFINNNILYFSSNGYYGLGLLDIYKINLENTKAKAFNLGAPINSNMDDFAFTLVDKNKGYFSSNRKKGKGDDDIYSFTIKDKKCFEAITGTIFNELTNLTLKGANVELIDASGKVIETQISNTKGVFNFSKQLCNQSFTIRAHKPDFTDDLKKLSLLSENGAIRTVELTLKPLIIKNESSTNDQIVVNPIYFDLNKSNIRSDAAFELEKVVDVLNNNPTMIIKIESHTDSRATDQYNLTLSDRRAKSTRDYIYSRGIDKNRIQSAIGYGETILINKCENLVKCTEEEHQKNRRSMFIILK